MVICLKSGKSTLVKGLLREAKAANLVVAAVAHTNKAAANVSGQTITTLLG